MSTETDVTEIIQTTPTMSTTDDIIDMAINKNNFQPANNNNHNKPNKARILGNRRNKAPSSARCPRPAPVCCFRRPAPSNNTVTPRSNRSRHMLMARQTITINICQRHHSNSNNTLNIINNSNNITNNNITTVAMMSSIYSSPTNHCNNMANNNQRRPSLQSQTMPRHIIVALWRPPPPLLRRPTARAYRCRAQHLLRRRPQPPPWPHSIKT